MSINILGHKLGGGGYCEYCWKYDGNIAYHLAWQCEVCPTAYPARLKQEIANRAAKEQASEQTFVESLDKQKNTLPTKEIPNIELSLAQSCDEFFSDNPADGTQRMYVPKPNGFTFKCDGCKNELTTPGAILFSPPLKTDGKTLTVQKFHLCQECFQVTCDVNNLSNDQLPIDTSTAPFTSVPLPMSFDPKKRRPR